jgi:hypothetical protein
MAAGALYSTTEDLLKWEQGLFGGKVLQPASLRKDDHALQERLRLRPQHRQSAGGHKVIEHGGGIERPFSYFAYDSRYPHPVQR